MRKSDLLGFHQLGKRWLKALETLLPNERGWADIFLTYNGPKVSLRWGWRGIKQFSVPQRKGTDTCPFLPSTRTHTGAQEPPGERRYRERPNQKQLSDIETTPADAPAECGWELVKRGRGHLTTNKRPQPPPAKSALRPTKLAA